MHRPASAVALRINHPTFFEEGHSASARELVAVALKRHVAAFKCPFAVAA
jgi:hypothetical protein